MFGRQSQFNWWYVIRGRYLDGATDELVLLPVPRQAPRDFWQRGFVDFKELKFELNIYNNRVAREAYSRYLARQFPRHDGRELQSIRWDLCYQMVLPPDVAMRERRLVDPRCYSRLLDDFPIGEQLLPVARCAR